MSTKLQSSLDNGVHFQLGRLHGNWEGVAKTWFEPGKLGDESPVKGTMRPLLGGRFVLHEYTGSLGGKPLEGLAIFGYHLDLKTVQSAWIDSFHNGSAIMFSEGIRNSTALSMTGHYWYIAPGDEQKWRWRTIIDIISDDEIHLTAYNVYPDGMEAKATETIYKRVK